MTTAKCGKENHFGCKMAYERRLELQQITDIFYPHVEFYEADFKKPPNEYEMEIKKLLQSERPV
jgi:hypothetical protein